MQAGPLGLPQQPLAALLQPGRGFFGAFFFGAMAVRMERYVTRATTATSDEKDSVPWGSEAWSFQRACNFLEGGRADTPGRGSVGREALQATSFSFFPSS